MMKCRRVDLAIRQPEDQRAGRLSSANVARMRLRPVSLLSALSLQTACLALLIGVPCRAEPASVAVVWYRGAEGCPDAAEFLSRLGARATLARVAEAGDYIDFVVTLVTSEQRSTGRIERQTHSGTVAIQEIGDTECSRVADALALSLSLALDPALPVSRPSSSDSNPSTAPTEQPSPAAEQGRDTDSSVLVLASPQPPATTPTPSFGEAGPRGVPTGDFAPAFRPFRAAPRRLAWLVGAHGGLSGGTAPEIAARGDLFVELGWALRAARERYGSTGAKKSVEMPGPDASNGVTMRLAVVGATSSPEFRSAGTVRHSVIAGRLDACSPNLGTATIAWRSCLGLELGSATAAGSRTTGVRDTAFWAALTGMGRARLWLSRTIGFEAELGLVVPLRRYVVESTEGELYKTHSLGFSGVLGPVIGLY
jgi:hypothetical protein